MCSSDLSTIQDCNDPEAWPLARIATSIAAEEPDLIVFTGDFFYREVACPDDKTSECGGSPAPLPGMPFKDSANGWSVDVFTPMSPVLRTAPILLARGNHEQCNRGGNGYFIYMDPRTGTENECAPFVGADGSLKVRDSNLQPSYYADVQVAAKRNLRIVVVDSASPEDCTITVQVPRERVLFEQAQEMARDHESWLLIHRPIVGWQPNDDCGPDGGWISADVTLASKGLLSEYQTIVSSHIHLAQAVNIPGIPGHIIVGNGGSLLEDATFPVPAYGPDFPGVSYGAPTSAWQEIRFGYTIATPGSGMDWVMHMKDPGGVTYAECTLAAKRITCVDS